MKTNTLHIGGIFLLFTLCLLSFRTLSAQDIESVAKDKSFKISGSINLNLGLYDAYGIDPRRDRFSYLVSGMVNPRLFGIDTPMSAVYSQQETVFLQPFNQFGISPSYKWAKLHLGYRALSYSPFTLNGHLFLGVGTELTPTLKRGPVNLRVSAMYGQFRRPVEPLFAQENGGQASYRRMGYAAKFGFVGKKETANYIDFSLIKAEDRLGSIDEPINNVALLPEENLALGVTGQYRLFKKLVFNADFGTTALSRDTRTERSTESVKGVFNAFNGLYTNRASTIFRNAVKAKITYAPGAYSIGVQYSRIDPEYRTHGSYFFLNDVEDFTFNAATQLAKGKIRIAGNIGLQRNNLDEEKSTTGNRVIGSLNYSHNLTDNFNYNITYSNFSSSVLVARDLLTDSLNLYQVTRSLSVGAGLQIGTEKRPQSVTLNLSRQTGNSRDEYFINESQNDFYNVTANYAIILKETGWTFQTGINLARSIAENTGTRNFGPSFSVGKHFLDKKLQARYVTTYLNAKTDTNSFGILNNRLNLNYRVGKKHMLKFGLGLLNKIDDLNGYSEVRGTAGYNWRF